jgi:hypothetical protein
VHDAIKVCCSWLVFEVDLASRLELDFAICSTSWLTRSALQNKKNDGQPQVKLTMNNQNILCNEQ